MIYPRIYLAVGLALALITACAPAGPQLGSDGQPLPLIHRIDPDDTAQVRFRMLDSVNAFRRRAGAEELVLNAELIAAAAMHSRDMAVQNRPWHVGSDGSSPADRAARAGYNGTVLGETISETYAAELATITAWMARADTRDVLTDASARDLGVAFHQDDTGKIWWALVTGDGGETGATTSPQG